MSEDQAAKPSTGLTIASWVARLVAAGILAMAGFAKLSGDEGSVYIFADMLGAPAAAHIVLGAVELLTAVLLIAPVTTAHASLLAVVLMVGAIGAHLFKLGISIEIPADAPEGVADSVGGMSLFVMAVVTLVAAGANAFMQRGRLRHKKPAGL